jgi:hypothetical protein
MTRGSAQPRSHGVADANIGGGAAVFARATVFARAMSQSHERRLTLTSGRRQKR